MTNTVRVRLTNGPGRGREFDAPAERGLWCSPAPGQILWTELDTDPTLDTGSLPPISWDLPPQVDEVVKTTAVLYRPLYRRAQEYGVLRPGRTPVFADGAYLYLTDPEGSTS